MHSCRQISAFSLVPTAASWQRQSESFDPYPLQGHLHLSVAACATLYTCFSCSQRDITYKTMASLTARHVLLNWGGWELGVSANTWSRQYVLASSLLSVAHSTGLQALMPMILC